MDGEMFLAYVRKFLCPTCGLEIVILDNLSSQRWWTLEEAITATAQRCSICRLISDLNPKTKFFSSSRRCCAKRQAILDDLWKEIGNLLNDVTQSE